MQSTFKHLRKVIFDYTSIIFLGSLLLPEYWKYYQKSYRMDKQANPFQNWDYEQL